MTDTIYLELTPREAALIFDFVLTCNWQRGSYSGEVKAIYDALHDVSHAFADCDPLVYKDNGAQVDVNEIFVSE